MKPITSSFKILLPGIFACFISISLSATQEDTVYVYDIPAPPVFDGIGNDACWELANWQVIDQVWIPYGTIVDSADLYGRYKVLWSGSENVLYFLLEISDDVISEGYVPGSTAAIYNFDMFEVFIDEDKSGGFHVLDGGGSQDEYPGNNAENAFAYHIFTQFPESGMTTEDFRAEDIRGTNWGSANYVDHFPHFITRQHGSVTTREFSLKVYNNTYSESNPEGSRVTLLPGKIMGLSLAINEDDEPEIDPSLTERDNFLGSVAVTEAAYNDHWMNADDFGAVKLISDIFSEVDKKSGIPAKLQLFPNPSSSHISVEFSGDYYGDIILSLYDIYGREIYRANREKSSERFHENIEGFNNIGGIYVLKVGYGSNAAFGKINYLR